METILLLSTAIASLIGAVAGLAAWMTAGNTRRAQRESTELLRRELLSQMATARQDTARTMADAVQALAQSQQQAAALQDRRLADLSGQFTERQEALRSTLNRQLDQMRETVDEKLQKTLEERLARSFAQVSERLEQVYKGLGEMQTLATGVGDLKKVLSNVKTRGILGEIQLAAILEQLLSPAQYAANVATRKGSTNVVEFAVRLPGDGKEPVWLPIDSKFPGDTYAALVDAYETGDPDAVAAAGKALESRIKGCAKDIRDKYLDPPNTTDFAILFLPFEGLYAEVVRRGMIEELSRSYHINIAGPTTMAALLNSLQMGFRTLAIEKRSSEVWRVLGAVKTEFSAFGTVLEKAQNRLRLANDDLDKLIGTRSRAIARSLREVTELPQEESGNYLAEAEDDHAESK